MRKSWRRGLPLILLTLLVFGGILGLLIPGSTSKVLAAGENEWVECAGELGFCDFMGTKELRFGAEGSYVYGIYTDGVSCTNDLMGDPAPLTQKQCYTRNLNFAGGTGSEENPLLIANAEQLDAVRDYMKWSFHFKLIADIDLGITPYSDGEGWVPIGWGEDHFYGKLDGNGHSITGLKINRPEESFVGLFGLLGEGGQVTNLRLEDVNVTGSSNVGGLVGLNSYGSISNSYVTGVVHGISNEIGGLVGYNDGSISNAYATTAVSGNYEIGGLVGVNSNGTISNSYATGHVSGNETTGGLVGANSNLQSVSFSYYDIQETGQSDEGKGLGRSTVDMKLRYTYSEWDFGSEWYYSSVWYMLPNQYPQLWASTSLSQGTTPGTTKLNNVAEGMEYSTDYETFIPIHGSTVDNILAKEEDRIIVRYVTGNDTSSTYLSVSHTDIRSVAFAGGDGTEQNPYQIATADQLNEVRYHLNAHYKLIAHIDLSSYYYWKPIGKEEGKFQGHIDGNGYRISNLRVNEEGDYLGLFAYIGRHGVVTNMQLASVDVSGFSNVGGLAGQNEGAISNSYATGIVGGYHENVGGLVGANVGGNISGSYTAGQVEGYGTNVGGLAGLNHSASITNSYSTASVRGRTVVGGLVGQNEEYATITTSYALGSVDTNEYEGSHGGLVGLNFSSTTSSYYISEFPEPDYGSGAGKLSAHLKLLSTYDSSWDFENIWDFDSSQNNGYPILRSFYVKLTYDGNGNTEGNVPASHFYLDGESVSVANNGLNLVRTGFTFAGWNTSSDGSGTSYAVGDTVQITADTTLYAKWTQIKYIVTFDSNGGELVSKLNIDYGLKITPVPTAPKKENFIFDAWYKDSDRTMLWNFATDAVLGDTTLYANWTPVYVVTFDTNGGTDVAQLSVNYGSTITTAPNAPMKEHYIFDSWYKDSNRTIPWTFGTDTGSDTVLGTTTLYANWSPAPYVVTFDTNGGTDVEQVSVNYGSTITTAPTAPMKEHYIFDSWYKDSNRTIPWTFGTDTGSDTVLGTTTLYANWTPAPYVVTFDTNGGTDVEQVSVNYGSTITTAPTAPMKEHYIFDSWYKDSNRTIPWTFGTDTGSDTVLGTTTLYANWTPAPYVVTFDTNGGTDVAQLSVNYGSTITTAPTAPTKEHYIFDSWYKDSNRTIPWTFGTDTGSDTVLGTTTLYANWTPVNYNVYFETSEGSNVPKVTTSYGSTIAVPDPAPTKANYTFAGWYKDSDRTLPWTFVSDTVLEDITLYAKWTQNNYAVTFETDGGSAITVLNAVYGATITAPDPDPTKANHTFAGWYKDSNRTTLWDFTTDTVLANTTLYAKWTSNSYAVSFESNGGSAVSNVPAAFGKTITAPPDPTKPNYTFAGWYKQDALSKLWHFDTDTVLANTTLYAKWLSTSATLTSSIGYVNTNGTVTNITYGTTLEELKSAIMVSSQATYTIYEADGITEATTLTSGCIIRITAEDGVTNASYIVSVNEPPNSNALLSGLTVESEQLSTMVLTHTVNVSNSVSNLQLLFTQADPTQTISVTGAVYSSVTNNVYSYLVSDLQVGVNPIRITVTAQDGSSTNTYQINVIRESVNMPELIDLNQDHQLDILDVIMTIYTSPVTLTKEDVEALLRQIPPMLR
ncbi:InlB B-repeat-containing protein [Paenibacillus roseipurpureus]|uniref:InlB B-repeat-containing protein n=1 Tax=Paenibacillus roseopurpureus TaxID=2918901 RepID=A0AA96LQ96_9BACL|nr:InlB B-repeat-containing protein [Paenibacillus sp. MBLB1832]WNR45164.1 InlB B-repeat-containing protein [Paenibacillus sp. MBLB1832]